MQLEPRCLAASEEQHSGFKRSWTTREARVSLRIEASRQVVAQIIWPETAGKGVGAGSRAFRAFRGPFLLRRVPQRVDQACRWSFLRYLSSDDDEGAEAAARLWKVLWDCFC